MRFTLSRVTQWVFIGSLSSVISFACDSNPELTKSGGSGASNGLGDGDGDDNGDGDMGGAGDGDFVIGDGDNRPGGDGDGDTGLGGGDGDSCAESGADAELVPANLLFVVDKSGSMNCNPPPTQTLQECETNPQKVDDGERSKWEITQQALTGSDGALEVLSGQPGVSVGLVTFPVDDFCAVPAEGELTVSIDELDASHLDDLTDALTESADGNTPLAGAAIRGLEALRRGIVAGELEGDNYLVVMTDGAETCQEAALDDLLMFVEEAYEGFGIRTYAIGAPGSEGSRELLSELAVLGGTRKSDDCKVDAGDASESCHIDLTESADFESDLGDEFRGITEATTQTCEYDVPSNALVDRSKVNVEFTPFGGDVELIPQDDSAECADAEGWQYSEDGSQIVLCGEACDNVLSDPGARVRVVFGCRETITVVK